MITGPGFALHPLPSKDIVDIWEYIAADSIEQASRFRDALLASIRSLVSFPHRGHRRRDLTSRPVRFIVVRDYLVAYAPDEKPLWVIAVIHGRRDPRIMAAILRGRE